MLEEFYEWAEQRHHGEPECAVLVEADLVKIHMTPECTERLVWALEMLDGLEVRDGDEE
jgi:hypothetical protein